MPGKMRSPNYPALTLPAAVEAARKLWQEEQKTAVDHDTAAKDMGYKSLSGPARVAIGSMRQYGLIDRTDRGFLRLSDLAVRILHGDDSQRSQGMREAATNPGLFQELAASHANASDAAIRSYLITKKGFAEDGARKAARAFRETMALVSSGDTGYTSDDEPEGGRDMVGQMVGQQTPREDRTSPPSTPADGVLALTVPYARGTIGVQIRVSGESISARHLAAVGRYLKLAEADLIEWPDGELPPQGRSDGEET